MFFKIIFILLAIFSLKTFSAEVPKEDKHLKSDKLTSKQLEIIRASIQANTKLAKK